MRKTIALAAGLLVLLLVDYGIYKREHLLRNGRVVLLELSPVDPRSLLQGDYMRLSFAVADEAVRRGQAQADGHVVVSLDGRRIGSFRRLGGAEALARDEVALRYRLRGGQMRFATDAYFFEEGTGSAYSTARYGEFRVGPDGDMILTRLRGPRLEVLPAVQAPDASIQSR